MKYDGRFMPAGANRLPKPEVFRRRFHTINYFTVVRLVTWPLNGSEVGGDPVLIQTSLLFCVNQVVIMLTN